MSPGFWLHETTFSHRYMHDIRWGGGRFHPVLRILYAVGAFEFAECEYGFFALSTLYHDIVSPRLTPVYSTLL